MWSMQRNLLWRVRSGEKVSGENTLYSDTIITDSSLTADALSTVCYLMGYEAANNLVDQLENVDALFITNDNELHYTKNFLR